MYTIKSDKEIEPTARDHEDQENDDPKISSEFIIQGVAHTKKQQLLILAMKGDGFFLDNILATWTYF
jgi:hypothetical protein